MNSINTSSVQGMTEVDISKLSIEDAITVVNMFRMQNCEDRVKFKMTEAQVRNVKIANLNTVYADMQNLSGKFKADAGPTSVADDLPGWKDNNYGMEQNTNNALNTAGLLVSPSPIGLKGNCTTSDGSVYKSCSVDGQTTKSQIESAVNTLKSMLDNLSSSSQTDMIDLQSLTGKYTASTDATSTNIKKFQDLIDRIQRNM